MDQTPETTSGRPAVTQDLLRDKGLGTKPTSIAY